MLRWLLECIGIIKRGHSPEELARRLEISLEEMEGCQAVYHEFSIAKRSGKGRRKINAPEASLKRLQRRILKRLLGRLEPHPAATGFRRGESFVTNAVRHRGREVVIHIDLVDFFPSISAERVEKYFRTIGWSRSASRTLTRLVTHQDVLPQGAPTSPCLSNLVCRSLDSRLSKYLVKYDAVYTRYADDMTISLNGDSASAVRTVIDVVLSIIRSEGFRPHLGQKKKLDVRRQHQRQSVTGLVVNQQVNLPRETRRWLRAVAHRGRKAWLPLHEQTLSDRGHGKPPSISREQFDGWLGLIQMIRRQRDET
ncbi:MAG: reverse transcriptase family protein [Mariniblastus sp.]|nr:reverse transcriptase family protein [Mariniblastus sp.]